MYIHSLYLSIDSFHHLFISSHPSVHFVHMSIYYFCSSIHFVHLSIYPWCLSIYLPIHCINICILSIYLSICPSTCMYLSFPPIYLSTHSLHPSMHFVHLHVCMYLSIYLSILFLYLSINSLIHSSQDWNASDDFSDGISYTTTSISVHSTSWSILFSSR